MIKLISINIRGLGRDIKRKYIRELIRKEKAGVLCVQETKLVKLDDAMCYNLWESNDISWVHKGVDKEGGGILTMWDNKLFKCESSVKGKGFVLVMGDYCCGESGVVVKVLILNIYAPCSIKDKVLLWKEVENKLIIANCSIRCVVGDFNSITNSSERNGLNCGVVNNCDNAKFREFIVRCMLKDIPIVGRKFTWYRPNGTARSRLDRVIVSDEWLLQWPGSKQYILSRQVSDHCALVVKIVLLIGTLNLFGLLMYDNNMMVSKRSLKKFGSTPLLGAMHWKMSRISSRV